MKETIYPVIAYIARYWFLALLLVILWRAALWLRRDALGARQRASKLSDAGAIGEWAVVATGTPRVPEGAVFPATRDGMIGSARGCDVRLQSERVPGRTARFTLREDGLHIWPVRRGFLAKSSDGAISSNSRLGNQGTVRVDGVEVQREAVLRHGATLTVGSVTLQLRLFAGVRLAGETLDAAGPIIPERVQLPTPQLTVKTKTKPGRRAHEKTTDA